MARRQPGISQNEKHQAPSGKAGNAIVAPLAVEFIKAAAEAVNG